ncbi:MAG: SNF2-related protein [Gemmatimonadaceae bacterium]|nr:SNF2-related protein [Gemmatimonadaceae bacterium]
MDALVAVRRCIADAIVGGAPGGDAVLGNVHADEVRLGEVRLDDARLGEVRLRPHQVDAVRRLRVALQSHGGALLADAPGLGKTYVALALARDSGGAVVIAPAALKAQWMRAAAHAAVGIEWWSLEQLSRRPAASNAPLLVVDEAHHLRNPRTQRYSSAAALAIGKSVLLLSATPVHNRAEDRDALLALFLGSAAATLPANVLAQIIVRREAHATLLPRRRPVRWLTPSSGPDVSASLRALPSPLPAADGREAAALMRLTLAHAWSSSAAAFDATVRRALHHAGAIDDALAAGRWPTRRELRAWVTTAESSQLAFAALMAAPANGDVAQARTMLARHVHALETLRMRLAAARDDDTVARAALLRRVLTAHPGATVVAFSRYAGTIDALWSALQLDAGVVAITARGVRSAGGGLRRADVLSALASCAIQDARAPLRLVLSTDLLGEGLDLLAASVIVHLDQPWTPARLDQREGRARRLGSPHEAVTTYAVRPPRGAARLLALATRLRHKRAAMDASVAAGGAREALLAFVRPWLDAPRGGARLAAVLAGMEGWVAAVRDSRGRERVIVGTDDTMVEDDARLLDVLERVERGMATASGARQARKVRRRIRQWLRTDESGRLIRAHDGDGGSRAVIARRLDTALRAAPLHHRAGLQARITAAQARIAAMQGAGCERALTAAAQCTTPSALLDAVDAIGDSRHDKRPAARGARLLALLLLVADERDCATDRPPRPCSPHATACSGTAVTR